MDFQQLAKENPVRFRQMRKLVMKENASYGKAFVELPSPVASPKAPKRAWRNRDYLVQLYQEPSLHYRLTINSTQLLASGHYKDGLTWDELWAIKDAVGFGSAWAVEVFPPDGAVVNVANMRHLFILPEAPPYAWKKDS